MELGIGPLVLKQRVDLGSDYDGLQIAIFQLNDISIIKLVNFMN